MYFWIITIMLMGTAEENFDVSVTETAFGPMSKAECQSYKQERTHALADMIYENIYLGDDNGYRITDIEGNCVYSDGEAL